MGRGPSIFEGPTRGLEPLVRPPRKRRYSAVSEVRYP